MRRLLLILVVVATAAFRPVADTSRAVVERAIDDLIRNFWLGSDTTGFPYAVVHGYGTWPFTIWNMSTVIDVEYEWWKTTGSTDAANRITAEWRWLQNHYPTANITGCGATRNGAYFYTTSTAQDDAAWNVKTFLQIYDVTADATALSDAIALQACVATRWTAANGGLYYDDSLATKQIYQAQYALNAFRIWQINADAAQLAIAEANAAFINANMTYANGLYQHIVKADNSPWTTGNPNPSIPGSPICFSGNLQMAIFDAREYARTGLATWLTQATSLVTAMVARETVTSVSGSTVWMNDCDAFTNATPVVVFAREVVPVLPAALRAQVATLFANTAVSILANDRDATLGLYGGNWEGPLVGSWAAVGNGSDDTNVAINTQPVLMLIANYVVNGGI